MCPQGVPGIAVCTIERRRLECQNPSAEKRQKNEWAIALVGGTYFWAMFVRRTQIGARLSEVPRCAHRESWALLRPKFGVPNPPTRKKAKKRVGYSLSGGRLFMGDVRPPDSEWGRLYEGPQCACGKSRAQSRPKISTRRSERQNLPVEKSPKKEWGIALVGGAYFWVKFVRRTRKGARLCEGPRCARGESRVQPRPKLSARRSGRQNPPAEKRPKNGWAIALVGGAYFWAKIIHRTRNGERLYEGPW